jgi:RuvB-like protein 1 (pontin 52)
LQLLAPAAVLAGLKGRQGTLELEDVEEVDELFLDAKTSAGRIGSGGGFDGGRKNW